MTSILLALLFPGGCASPPPDAAPRPITYVVSIEQAGYPPGSDQLELAVHLVRSSEAPWDSVRVESARVVESADPKNGIGMDLYNRCFVDGLNRSGNPFPSRFSLIFRDRSSLHAFEHPVLMLELGISIRADRGHRASRSDRVHRLPFDQP